MDENANLLSYPPNLLQIEPAQRMDIDTGNTSNDKGKRKMGEDVIMTDLQATFTKKPREMKNLLLKVKEYATPTITTKDGKVIDIEKTIREHYVDLSTTSEMKINKV